ncbi:GNAT family N-acetyltransferase [Rossellomorea vietnamensis]|uniref:GNAT family N-acetyltransferase n=1 Tax=Rossellomorea vietnamensis TaxID=218284 RepID=UPI001E43BBA4|nr:GNAT family N-acetyltransferase [Rossellomorea vietnamensis]MCC5803217.1 GNAT family N-acetyltransferase [Rossellomorea vietnamensis]
MKNDQDISIQLYYTNDINSAKINDFINLHNKVFQSNFNEQQYKKKYINNIYGPSIIVLSYVNNKCAGARAFWRNDLENLKAYQPCDTAVLDTYRGLGIFTKMTFRALEEIDKGAFVYNFPNDNSYPGYLKMGWKLKDKKRYKLYNPLTDNKTIDKLPNKYARWLIEGSKEVFNDSVYYLYTGGHYYLVKKKKFNLFVIIAEIEKEVTTFLKKAYFPIILCYSTKGYLGRGLYTVIKNTNSEISINIPLYKIDTIF